jgi:hypothetical protein
MLPSDFKEALSRRSAAVTMTSAMTDEIEMVVAYLLEALPSRLRWWLVP